MEEKKQAILELIKCITCKGDMPKLRLDKFGYKHCINCSTEKPKKGVSFSLGVGEDTWDETIIMEEDQFRSYYKSQIELNKLK